MVAAMGCVGNPSSVHAEGRVAKALVEKARAQVAEAFGADGADVIFTSGATEAAAFPLVLIQIKVRIRCIWFQGIRECHRSRLRDLDLIA